MASHDQTWAGEDSGRPRVLIECPPSLSPAIIADVVSREGYAVRTCDGPRETPCHLLDEGACALVAEADIVVNMLGTGRQERRGVLDAVAGLRRPPAVVAEATAADATLICAAHPEVVVVTKPMRASSLIQGIETALATTRPGRPDDADRPSPSGA